MDIIPFKEGGADVTLADSELASTRGNDHRSHSWGNTTATAINYGFNETWMECYWCGRWYTVHTHGGCAGESQQLPYSWACLHLWHKGNSSVYIYIFLKLTLCHLHQNQTSLIMYIVIDSVYASRVLSLRSLKLLIVVSWVKYSKEYIKPKNKRRFLSPLHLQTS